METTDSIQALGLEFDTLLKKHGMAGEEDPSVATEIQDIDKIVRELDGLIKRAASVPPSSNKEAAILLHMALINLGIDQGGGLSGHMALRAVVRHLKRAASAPH